MSSSGRSSSRWARSWRVRPAGGTRAARPTAPAAPLPGIGAQQAPTIDRYVVGQAKPPVLPGTQMHGPHARAGDSARARQEHRPEGGAHQPADPGLQPGVGARGVQAGAHGVDQPEPQLEPVHEHPGRRHHEPGRPDAELPDRAQPDAAVVRQHAGADVQQQPGDDQQLEHDAQPELPGLVPRQRRAAAPRQLQDRQPAQRAPHAGRAAAGHRPPVDEHDREHQGAGPDGLLEPQGDDRSDRNPDAGRSTSPSAR